MTILPRLKKDVAKSRLSMRNPWHLLATGFGSGLSPIVPGTMGSLAAIPFWYLMTFLPWQLYSLVVMLSICIGVYLCHQTAKDMGVHDHGSIVWDEFVGMWITLMALPNHDWQWVAAGFVIFRILDMWKPWPIRWFDRNVHGGTGIMIDDIVAGILSAGILYFIGHHWPVGII
ncbi:phosphatidylglycerophosphatase A [Citrobacter braakii]|uniref:phosphatidylglycerophosphatase A n=1 Tax=Citrobacter braakii TaxID=57706 RepID=UPI003976A695